MMDTFWSLYSKLRFKVQITLQWVFWHSDGNIFQGLKLDDSAQMKGLFFSNNIQLQPLGRLLQMLNKKISKCTLSLNKGSRMAFIKSVCPFYKLCIVNLWTITGDRGSCGNRSLYLNRGSKPANTYILMNIRFEEKLVWVEAGLTTVSDLLLPASSSELSILRTSETHYAQLGFFYQHQEI